MGHLKDLEMSKYQLESAGRIVVKFNGSIFVNFLFFYIFIIYTHSNYIHVSQIYYNAHHRKIIPLINVNFSSKCSFRKLSRFIRFVIIRLKTIIHIFVRFYNSQINKQKIIFLICVD